MVVQTVRHRDYFLPVGVDAEAEEHAAPPSNRGTLTSLGLLLVALVAVVGLAKIESPAIEEAVAAIGAPPSAVGVAIALLVLLPETLAAVRNARRDHAADELQPRLRLGHGQHRADHPGDRRRLDLARGAARSAWAPPRWSCWPSPSSSAG